jgi:AcrR family transcriptional regulator
LNSSQPAKAGRPPKDLRDRIRRDQIVAAGRTCVVRHGFHAATMAEIAAAARMSVGQIYRYFPNKEAIVHTIVERIVERRLQDLVKTAGRPDEAHKMAEQLAAGIPDESRDDDVLMLEVTAESTRNPAVANIVKQADQRLLAHAVVTFKRDHPKLEAHEVSARLELLAVLIEGTLLRRLTGRVTDNSSLRKLYRTIIERLLSKSA